MRAHPFKRNFPSLTDVIGISLGNRKRSYSEIECLHRSCISVRLGNHLSGTCQWLHPICYEPLWLLWHLFCLQLNLSFNSRKSKGMKFRNQVISKNEMTSCGKRSPKLESKYSLRGRCMIQIFKRMCQMLQSLWLLLNLESYLMVGKALGSTFQVICPHSLISSLKRNVNQSYEVKLINHLTVKQAQIGCSTAERKWLCQTSYDALSLQYCY